jgi:hypothetical protein
VAADAEGRRLLHRSAARSVRASAGQDGADDRESAIPTR